MAECYEPPLPPQPPDSGLGPAECNFLKFQVERA
jgi:hypothetical protein